MADAELNNLNNSQNNQEILQMPLNVDFLEGLINSNEIFRKLQEIVDYLNQNANQRELKEIREIFISMQESEHIRDAILQEIFNNPGIHGLIISLKMHNIKILLDRIKDTYRITPKTAFVKDIELPERTRNNFITRESERTEKPLTQKVEDKLAECEEKFYNIVKEVGTTNYLVGTIMSAFNGDKDRGPLRKGKHTVSTFLSVVFLQLSSLNDLTKDLEREELDGEKESLINQAMNFVNIYVNEINAHFVEAMSSPEIIDIFGSIREFMSIFEEVMSENPAYRDLGINYQQQVKLE